MSKAVESQLRRKPAVAGKVSIGGAAVRFLALAGLAWVFFAAGSITDPTIARLAKRVAAGENYDAQLLRHFIEANTPTPRQSCNPTVLRHLLILQLSVADASTHTADIQLADADTAALGSISQTLLTCSPADSFAWLSQYWHETRTKGFGPAAITFIDNSFRYAPHEGWIQIVRAPMAFMAFDALTPALKRAALNDFIDIFDANLFATSAIFYKNAPASVRRLLLDELCAKDEEARKIFKARLEDLDLTVRHPCFQDDRPSFRPLL